jgi:exosortase C (VPDSG-CTERM-specific)
MPKSSLENRETLRAATGTFRPESSGNLLSRVRLIGFIGFAILLAAAFGKPLVALFVHVANSNLHSYILLVPFVWGYLVYIRRNQPRAEYRSSPGWAAAPLVIGLAALGAAESITTLSRNDYLTLIALSFVSLLTAGGFLFLGRTWMSDMVFPFSFLIFLLPMPDAMANALETASKLASTEAANIFFNMTNTPTLRDGTIFHLPNITIEVAQECSGIRSSWVLFITSLLAANLFLKSPWRRVALVVAVIPLGIIRNGFRVWVIGTLCIRFGPQMLHSVIHRSGGPAFFVLSLIPLLLMLLWLHQGEIGKAPAFSAAGQTEGTGQSKVNSE